MATWDGQEHEPTSMLDDIKSGRNWIDAGLVVLAFWIVSFLLGGTVK